MIKKTILYFAFPFGRRAFRIFQSHIIHFQFVSKAYRGQFQPNTGVCARPRPGLHEANHFRDFSRHMEIAFNSKKSHIGGFGTGKRALAPVRGPAFGAYATWDALYVEKEADYSASMNLANSPQISSPSYINTSSGLMKPILIRACTAAATLPESSSYE